MPKTITKPQPQKTHALPTPQTGEAPASGVGGGAKAPNAPQPPAPLSDDGKSES
jgi:hypothetical protein